MLELCLINLLNDPESILTNIKTHPSAMKSYKNMKSIVISNMNRFIEETARLSLGLQLQIRLSEEQCSIICPGLFFFENSLIGMLEASNFDKIDHFSPFPASITNYFRE